MLRYNVLAVSRIGMYCVWSNLSWLLLGVVNESVNKEYFSVYLGIY
jgi:hypothetical protein